MNVSITKITNLYACAKMGTYGDRITEFEITEYGDRIWMRPISTRPMMDTITDFNKN